MAFDLDGKYRGKSYGRIVYTSSDIVKESNSCCPSCLMGMSCMSI